MIFYYSGCGNSAWTAKTLSQKLDDKLVFIPDAERHYDIAEDEAVGFVFPVYSWAPPELVMEFVERLTLSHSPRYLFMVCTCGDETGLTDKIFEKGLSKKGWRLDSAYSIQLPETYINLPGFKLDTPEGAVAKQEAAKVRLNAIADDLHDRKSGVRDLVVGGMPWFKSVPVKWLFYKLMITDKPFRSTDACVGCGVCVKSCPVKNIRLVDDRPEWQHHCVGCMSCYHHCPKNAIQWGKMTNGKGQYYYES